MASKEYQHKTTIEQYREMSVQSKNKGELLYKIWKNETNQYMPYPAFLSRLATWLRETKRTETGAGVEKINNYLSTKLAQK